MPLFLAEYTKGWGERVWGGMFQHSFIHHTCSLTLASFVPGQWKPSSKFCMLILDFPVQMKFTCGLGWCSKWTVIGSQH